MKITFKFLVTFLIFVLNVNAQDQIHLSNDMQNSASKRNSCGYNFSHGYADLIEKIMPSVVNISSTSIQERVISPLEQFFGGGMFPFGGNPLLNGQKIKKKATSLGSGFFIDKNGYIATNYHVIKDATEIKIKTFNNKEYNAKIIAFDPKTDLAVIKADTKNDIQPVTFGSSDAARIGDIVFAIGNPFGLGGTVTSGILSAKSRSIGNGINDDFLQTDAPINQGNSGGPMFNTCGEVIGINSAIFSTSGGNIGIGFAIASDNAINIIKKLKNKEKITRAWLGIEIQSLNKEMIEALGLKNESGVYINNVSKNSPASKAGLKNGDVIMSVDNKEITEARQISSYVASKEVGTIINMKIIRDGKNISISAKLEELKADIKSEDNSSHKTKIGIEVSDITEDIRHELKLPNEISGAVITKITNDKITEFGAIMIGDVITQVNSTQVRSSKEFEDASKALHKSDKKYAIFKVYRAGVHISIGLPIK